MKIKLKFLLLIFFMITFLVSNIYAVDMFLTSTNNGTDGTVVTSPSPSPEDENYDDALLLSEDETATQDTSEEIEQGFDDEILLSDFDEANEENEIYEDISTMQSPVVTSSTTSSDKLSATDYINIILIALCIVLIFLAVAILIRLK